MTEEIYARYWAIEEQLEHDGEMQHLKQRLQVETEALNKVLARLSEADRAVITEYIGICAEIEQRIVELACFAL